MWLFNCLHREGRFNINHLQDFEMKFVTSSMQDRETIIFITGSATIYSKQMLTNNRIHCHIYIYIYIMGQKKSTLVSPFQIIRILMLRKDETQVDFFWPIRYSYLFIFVLLCILATPPFCNFKRQCFCEDSNVLLRCVFLFFLSLFRKPFGMGVGVRSMPTGSFGWGGLMLQDPTPMNPKETSLMTHADASMKMYDINKKSSTLYRAFSSFT